ncbi:hypothetical protein H0H93_016447, partial [Arthromyces matolae]
MCHATVALAVKKCIPEISQVIDIISKRLKKGGRVLYIGAGTSGRSFLFVFSNPRFIEDEESQAWCTRCLRNLTNILDPSLMAGGDSAIRRSVEGAEDSTTQPIDDLSAIVPPVNALDTLIGIAASGRTPYVLAGLDFAKKKGIFTVGVSCVEPSQMRGETECLIECVVGPEIVTGSTRMKAGTATKM